MTDRTYIKADNNKTMNELKDFLESCTVTRSTFNIEHAVTDFIKVKNRFLKSNYVHKRLVFIGCYYNQFFAQGFLLKIRL